MVAGRRLARLESSSNKGSESRCGFFRAHFRVLGFTVVLVIRV